MTPKPQAAKEKLYKIGKTIDRESKLVAARKWRGGVEIGIDC